ncbi:MAG TPA: aspartyl protease family protein [Oleiagrimonas sp.]|nr:aspartyl protease family protein [Oleiagrimonas sp.]
MGSSLRQYLFPLLCVLGAGAPCSVRAVPAATPTPAEIVLKQVRQAYGGERWARAGALLARGTESRDGLSGPLTEAVDLRTGFHAVHVDNGLFPTARGCDAGGCWRLGASGIVHGYDSAEAARTAVTHNWLARFGYLRAHEDSTFYRRLPDVRSGGKRYLRLQAIPAGGKNVTLWIDPATYRLARATWHESFVIATERYADYRLVGGLWLPFRVTDSSRTLTGAGDSPSVDVITTYQVLGRLPVGALQRPDRTVRDVTMAHGATRAVTPLLLDGGALLIEASINDSGPYLFILDTGGHAVLTRHTAAELGLTARGKGTSTGAGPGDMSLAFTKVAHLTIGNADIRDQVFMVMPIPYSFYERGRRRPIAGILGLEVFQRFAVTIDYDDQQVVLQPYDHGATPPPGKGAALPLSFTNDMPLIHATLDGRRGVFGIDTGNGGHTLVFPQWAARTGLFARYAKGSLLPTGGLGGRYMSRLSHAHALQLGHVRVTRLLIQLTRADAGATGNPSEAGNIGEDILSRFNLHFDYRRRRMYLAPRAQPHVEHFAAAGMTVTKLESYPDRFFVGWVLPGGPAAKVGIRPGDAFVKVNHRPVERMSGLEFRELSRGQPAGTRLYLRYVDGTPVNIVMRDVAQQ